MTLKSIGIVGGLLLSCSVLAAPKESTSGSELLRPAGATTKPQKFVAATKEQSDAAIAAAKKRGTEVEDLMKVKFGIIESPHFIIFTDWDKREYDFLRSNMEAAYEIVSRQFEIPVRDNVFIGKLPVYMFAKQEDFQKFSRDADGSEAPANVLGYYMGNNLGFGHMTMWKPKPGSTKRETSDAERKWATVLTHEFTHAFVARYRTNNFIPRWLNEGLAEVVAHKQFPRAFPIYPYVRDRQSTRGGSIQDVLTDKGMLSGDDYPVAQTVVETLLIGQPKSFLPFFNDIKDGMSAEEALQKEYKTDLKGLESNWKQYIKNAK